MYTVHPNDHFVIDLGMLWPKVILVQFEKLWTGAVIEAFRQQLLKVARNYSLRSKNLDSVSVALIHLTEFECIFSVTPVKIIDFRIRRSNFWVWNTLVKTNISEQLLFYIAKGKFYITLNILISTERIQWKLYRLQSSCCIVDKDITNISKMRYF